MKITFANGENAGRVCEFVLPRITVGREDANDLRLPSEGVSRYHADFKQDLLRGGWVVSDQGSTNGVKVNGERISGERLLAENDRVEIGESLGTIHASSEEKARQAAAMLRQCYSFSGEPVEKPSFIKGIIR